MPGEMGGIDSSRGPGKNVEQFYDIAGRLTADAVGAGGEVKRGIRLSDKEPFAIKVARPVEQHAAALLPDALLTPVAWHRGGSRRKRRSSGCRVHPVEGGERHAGCQLTHPYRVRAAGHPAGEHARGQISDSASHRDLARGGPAPASPRPPPPPRDRTGAARGKAPLSEGVPSGMLARATRIGGALHASLMTGRGGGRQGCMGRCSRSDG